MLDDEYEEISEFWPESFHEVVYCIGEANAFCLSLLLAGVNLNIPKISPEQGDSTPWNGLPKFLQESLFEHFAGDRIFVPTLRKAKEVALLFVIDELGMLGLTVQEIAIRLGVLEETVYHYRRNRKTFESRLKKPTKPKALPLPKPEKRALPAPMWVEDGS